MMTNDELDRVQVELETTDDAGAVYALAIRLLEELTATRRGLAVARQRYGLLLPTARATLASHLDAGPPTVELLAVALAALGEMPAAGECPIDILTRAVREPAPQWLAAA